MFTLAVKAGQQMVDQGLVDQERADAGMFAAAVDLAPIVGPMVTDGQRSDVEAALNRCIADAAGRPHESALVRTLTQFRDSLLEQHGVEFGPLAKTAEWRTLS
jgi:hypothetical protein